MPNRERFFDVGRYVVVVEASRYWNFYEGVLIGNVAKKADREEDLVPNGIHFRGFGVTTWEL